MSELKLPLNNAGRDAALADHDGRLTAIEAVLAEIKAHPALSIPSLVSALQSSETKPEGEDVRNEESQPGQ